MGTSARKFVFEMFYNVEQTKVDSASNNAPGQSSESQSREKCSYGLSLSACFDSQSLGNNPTNHNQICDSSEAVDGSTRVQSLTDSQECKSNLSSANNDSTSSCRENNTIQQPSLSDKAGSTIKLENTAGNNGPSSNRQDGLPNQEEETASSTSIRDQSDTEYWNNIVEALIPKGDWKGVKVLVVNMQEDCEVADELANSLRTKFSCKIPRDPYNTLCLAHNVRGLTEAQKWADVILVVVSPSWVQAVKNVRPTHESDSETTKYLYIALQKTFLKDSCINYKMMFVLKPETDPNIYSDIVEIRSPYTLDYLKENFQFIVTDFMKLSDKAKRMIHNPCQIPSSDSQPSTANSRGDNATPNSK